METLSEEEEEKEKEEGEEENRRRKKERKKESKEKVAHYHVYRQGRIQPLLNYALICFRVLLLIKLKDPCM